MSNECCIVCKNQGKTVTASFREMIFKKTKNHTLWLCYKHSLEFFKFGQEQFFLRYPAIAKSQKWDEIERKRVTSFF